jgi:sRNA-binding carbon storage regulator CsrA
MMVLSRKKQQSVVVECSVGFERLIRVTVLAVHGEKVTLGIDVEDDVSVPRSDVTEQRQLTVRPHQQRGRRAWASAEADRWDDDGG